MSSRPVVISGQLDHYPTRISRRIRLPVSLSQDVLGQSWDVWNVLDKSYPCSWRPKATKYMSTDSKFCAESNGANTKLLFGSIEKLFEKNTWVLTINVSIFICLTGMKFHYLPFQLHFVDLCWSSLLFLCYYLIVKFEIVNLFDDSLLQLVWDLLKLLLLDPYLLICSSSWWFILWSDSSFIELCMHLLHIDSFVYVLIQPLDFRKALSHQPDS